MAAVLSLVIEDPPVIYERHPTRAEKAKIERNSGISYRWFAVFSGQSGKTDIHRLNGNDSKDSDGLVAGITVNCHGCHLPKILQIQKATLQRRYLRHSAPSM